MHLSSSSIIYMKENTSRGQFELAYLAGGKRIAKLNVTTTPTVIGDAAEGLVTITNEMFSLINSDYILDTVDHTSFLIMKYQLPNNGRVINLGKVLHTLSALETNLQKSPGQTARVTSASRGTTNTGAITTNATAIDANTQNITRAGTQRIAQDTSINSILSRLTAAGIR